MPVTINGISDKTNMAKQISQGTFDDVVRENMAEFDMTPIEAMEDAVKQFQSQGCNLDNIVQNASLYSQNDDVGSTEHFVVTTMVSLGDLIDQEEPSFDIITPALQTIRDECAKDLAHRCLASQNNGYNTLVKCLIKSHTTNNTDLIFLTLEALVNFSDGQPDHFNAECAQQITTILDAYSSNNSITAKAVKLLRFNSTKHERNRLMVFGEFKIVGKLVALLEVQDQTVMLEVCKLLRTLTNDDDIRVVCGKGIEHAKLMVMDHNLLSILSIHIKEYKSNSALLSEFILTLSKLVIRDEFCTQVYDTGILPIVIESIQLYIDNIPLVKNSLLLLKALAGNDKVKREVINNQGAETVVLVLLKHQSAPGIAEGACLLVAALALRNPGQCPLMVEAGVHGAVIQSMKIHTKVMAIQKAACMALRNLVSHNEELKPAILEQGVEMIINATLTIHGEKLYEAKAALRDLGCDVKLTEQWKGEKAEIHR